MTESLLPSNIFFNHDEDVKILDLLNIL
ncbi:MAG: hypothetical protein ACI9W5_000762 [Ulvibacter sp.]